MVEKLETQKEDVDRFDKFENVVVYIFGVIGFGIVVGAAVFMIYGLIWGTIYRDEHDAAEEESARAYAYELNEPYRQAAQVAIAELNQELADDMSPVTILNTVIDFYCRAPYDAKVFDDEKLIRTYATQQWEANWRSDIIDLPYSFDAAVSERCG